MIDIDNIGFLGGGVDFLNSQIRTQEGWLGGADATAVPCRLPLTTLIQMIQAKLWNLRNLAPIDHFTFQRRKIWLTSEAGR